MVSFSGVLPSACEPTGGMGGRLQGPRGGLGAQWEQGLAAMCRKTKRQKDPSCLPSPWKEDCLFSGDVMLGYGPGPYVAVNMIFNSWKKLFAQWEYENGSQEHRVRPSTETLTLEPSKSGFV